jgi:allantoate deiminase
VGALRRRALPDLRGDLARAIAAEGHPVRELASGAGHDAAVLSRICPAAMLFVRCAGGISHDPRRRSTDDVAVALDVLEGVVRAM